jgi:hypothetical protein
MNPEKLSYRINPSRRDGSSSPATSLLSQIRHGFQNPQEEPSTDFPLPLWEMLNTLLEDYPATADEVDSLLAAWAKIYPQLPVPNINYPDESPFPRSKPYYVHRTHLTPDDQNFQVVTENIWRTRRNLNAEDEKYLRDILRFPFGWSATLRSHQEDPWVQYIRHRFPHIQNLYPILDDMTWLEEIDLLPLGYGPGAATFLLLANESYFFLYYHLDDELLRIGTSLKETYIALSQGTWLLEWDDERRYSELDNEEEYERVDYFLDWEACEGGWKPANTLKAFVSHSPLSDNDDDDDDDDDVDDDNEDLE